MRSSCVSLVVCALALALISAGSAAPASGRPEARGADPGSTAKRLVIHFFVLIERKDRRGLDRLLSPAFQVQRADGSGSAKGRYLANLPTVRRFFLSSLTATEAGGVLVVRYLARVEGLVNGKPYTPGYAPRLTVFSWNGKRWHLTAHANFNPLTT